MKLSPLSILTFLSLLIFCSASAIEVPSNYQISSPNYWLQYGEHIFMHPTDAQTIISVWRDYRTGHDVAIGRSTDGGETWSESFVSPSQHIFDRLSDPSITYDNTLGSPSVGERQFDFIVNDGGVDSNVGESTVNIVTNTVLKSI